MTPHDVSLHEAPSRLLRWLPLAVALAATAGCGGSGTASSPPAAKAPQLVGLAAVSIDQDTTSPPQAFRVVDPDTVSSQLELALATSDPAVLPLSGIVVRGEGADRTIEFTPAPEATGTANVTVTARDPGGLMASATVAVQVKPVLVSFKALASSAFAIPEGGAITKVTGVTVSADADDDPAAFDALLR